MIVYTVKEYLYKIFTGYRKMNARLKKSLTTLGIILVYGKKHIRLYKNGKSVSIPSTSSDVRAGRNIASIIYNTFFNIYDTIEI